VFIANGFGPRLSSDSSEIDTRSRQPLRASAHLPVGEAGQPLGEEGEQSRSGVVASDSRRLASDAEGRRRPFRCMLLDQPAMAAQA